MNSDSLVHLVAGGLAGTLATILTCPLEVIKTRLQSSNYVPQYEFQKIHVTPTNSHTLAFSRKIFNYKIPYLIRHTYYQEGLRGLFKGLLPNLVGVAPARSIYFCAYSNSKSYLEGKLGPNNPSVFILSATFSGLFTSTLTNPIWYIKTKLQLDQSTQGHVTLSTWNCIKDTWREFGFRGFYKGVTASYYGVSETALNFLIYESLKGYVSNLKTVGNVLPLKGDQRENESQQFSPKNLQFLELMSCAAFAKTFAATLAYPHEVARTRMREGKSKYRSFWQTIFLVWREESYIGLYRGLLTHLIRQIPNTAITLATYETLAHFINNYFAVNDNKEKIIIVQSTIPNNEHKNTEIMKNTLVIDNNQNTQGNSPNYLTIDEPILSQPINDEY